MDQSALLLRQLVGTTASPSRRAAMFDELSAALPVGRPHSLRAEIVIACTALAAVTDHPRWTHPMAWRRFEGICKRVDEAESAGVSVWGHPLEHYNVSLFGHAHDLARRGQLIGALTALGELRRLLVLAAGDTRNPYFDTQYDRIECARTRIAFIEAHPHLRSVGLRAVEKALRVDGSLAER